MKVTREKLEDGSNLVYVNYTPEDIEEIKKEVEAKEAERSESKQSIVDNNDLEK